jgi:hypothetical protein
VTAHHIVALLNFLQEPGDLLGRILQVPVEGDDDLPLRPFKTRKDRHMLAVIAVETNDFDRRMELIQPLQELCRVIGTAIIDEEHLVALTHPMEGAHQPVSQRFERRCLIQDRHDDGEIDALTTPLPYSGRFVNSHRLPSCPMR